MKKTLLLLVALISMLTVKAQPTDVPAVSADDAILLYSNGGQNGFNFYDWGGGRGIAVDINGTQVYQISNFAYFGCGFSKMDVSNKKFYHIDVYPMQDIELGVVMINHNEAGTANDGEKGVNLGTLTANQWNSFDIPVQDYLDKDAAMTRLYQIKLVKKVVANSTGIAAGDGFENADRSETFYIGNEYFYGTRVEDTENPVLVSAEATDVKGEEVTITMNATDNNDKITYIITDAAHNKSYTKEATSGNDATITIKGLSGLTEYTFTVQAKDIAGNLSETQTVTFTTGEGFKLTAAPTPTVDAAVVKSIFSDVYTPATTYNIGGWEQSTQYETMTVGSDNLIHLQNYNYLGFEFASDVDLSDMNYVHIDILPRQDMVFGITPIMRGGSPTENSQSVGTLVANQWNSIDIPLPKFGLDFTNFKAFQLKLDKGNGSDIVYVDNIYFYNNGQGDFFIETANGVATVGGTVTPENVAQINEADAMAIDLKGVTAIEEGVKIEPMHKNTLIIVTGTTGETNVADNKYAAITGTPNMVILRHDGYLFPVTQLQITDDPTEPQWMGERNEFKNIKFLSTGSTGYKVTRSLPAKRFGTIYTTSVVNAEDIPAGVTIWEATGYDGTTITFSKANDAAAFFPYVIYNANDEATDFSFSGTGDFNLLDWSIGNVASHAVGDEALGVAFQGNFATATTDGTQWIIQNAEGQGTSDESVVFKRGNGAKITAFRSYFTGLDAGVKAKFNNFNEVTGINSLNMNTTNNGKVYNLNGMEAKNTGDLQKGVYIVNGKKVIIK
ncbi:MAG: hypothetical protein ACOYJK_02020 [Prevotella sp.]|jgi:hypothetical protein